MIEINDGSRTLQFSGALLGKSSSKRSDSTRWIEFELYRTDNGSYILSRVGVSIMYHTAACTLARRYAVLEALYQYDSNGAKYLTNVAKKLLEEAAVLDQKIEKMYKVEIIP